MPVCEFVFQLVCGYDAYKVFITLIDLMQEVCLFQKVQEDGELSIGCQGINKLWH